MGSTFKAMGLIVQAFEFWWKALHIQPTFWDALVRIKRGVISWRSRSSQDNMLATILGSGHQEGDLPNRSQSQSFQGQQLRQSLQLCTFALDSIEGKVMVQGDLHHAQRILLLRSIVYRGLHDKREWADLFRGVGLALNSSGPSRTPPYTTDHLILVAYFVGALACGGQVGPTAPGLESTMKITDELRQKISPNFDVFDFVETNSDHLLGIVGKSPPILLLSPAEALYLPSAMWTPTHTLSPPDSVSRFSASGSFRDETSAITGELLSTLAARIAEMACINDLGPDGPGVGPFGNLSKFQPSLSVVLLLRYVALGLAPSPQAFKALGDLISSIEENVTRAMVGSEIGSEMKLDVAGVAMLYYEFGMKTL
jgi:protein O-GlcNAc transferase